MGRAATDRRRSYTPRAGLLFSERTRRWATGSQRQSGRRYEFPIGPDEAVAVQTLGETRKTMGIRGTVTIAERLAIRGDTIAAIWIEERD
jgi:hypothetical protein